MKIKLIEDVPVEKKHGLLKGNEYDVEEQREHSSGTTLFMVKGRIGELCGVFPRECKIIKE